MRRGISLLEVLISMFVLAVGLLGVAALIPAGSAQVAAANKIDNSAMFARSAFADAQTRGFFDPTTWQTTAGNAVYRLADNRARPFTTDNGTTFSVNPAVVLDPLGVFKGYGPLFPSTADPSKPHLTRIVTTSTNNAAIADMVFRSHFDLVVTPPDKADFPPSQLWLKGTSGTAVARASTGDYSWFATIVAEARAASLAVPTAPSDSLTATIVVVHKRDLSGSPSGESIFPAALTSPNEWTVTLPAGHKGLKPSEWIMISGRGVVNEQVNPLPAPPTQHQIDQFVWYRIVGAAPPDSGTQRITVAGRDWNPLFNIATQVVLIPGVTIAAEHTIELGAN